MGLRDQGGVGKFIEEYLEGLAAAVKNYLGFVDDYHNAKTDMEKEDILTNRAVQPPGALIEMRRIGYPRRLPYPGAWIEQPYLWLRELETCHQAASEYETVRVRNLRHKMKRATQQAGLSIPT